MATSLPEDGAVPPAKRVRADGDAPGVVDLDELLIRLQDTPVLAKLPEDGISDFICTHHGSFHADEAMACAMLKCLPAFANLPILRTRNQAEIDRASIVVDVGGTYEPGKHRYDHHQKSFSETYSEAYPEIKLSSAGLVFKHFGKEVIQALCGELDGRSIAAIVAKTYESLIRELDALDNGVQVSDSPPRYRFVSHLGARVGRLNPSWQDPSTPELENTRFREAMVLAAKELSEVVRGYSKHWLPARTIVQDSLAARKEVHPSGEIMKLTRFCPWQEHLFDIEEEEEEAARTPLTKYVLFMDSRAGWRVQAVPKEKGSFENRLRLPKAWSGLRDQELSDAAGIPECVFVHANGFIGGHATEAGALQMAVLALSLTPQEDAAGTS